MVSNEPIKHVVVFDLNKKLDRFELSFVFISCFFLLLHFYVQDLIQNK